MLNDTSNYTDALAMCYEPRLGFVYYQAGAIIGHTDVCIECFRLSTDPAFWAPRSTFTGKPPFMTGLSQTGWQHFSSLCQELQFPACEAVEVSDQ